MLGVFVFASPMIVLSGYAAPVENMPPMRGTGQPGRSGALHAGDHAGLFLQDMPVVVVLGQAWPMR